MILKVHIYDDDDEDADVYIEKGHIFKLSDPIEHHPK